MKPMIHRLITRILFNRNNIKMADYNNITKIKTQPELTFDQWAHMKFSKMEAGVIYRHIRP